MKKWLRMKKKKLKKEEDDKNNYYNQFQKTVSVVLKQTVVKE